jgi:SAM-dependent methyltransferase
MSNQYSSLALTDSLDLLADTYNYNHWIYGLLRPYLGESICEVGAGIGNLSRFFLNAERLIAIEPEEEYSQALHKLSDVHLNMTVHECGIEDYALQQQDPVDSVVCVNVLEHIEDDEAMLKKFSEMINPDGIILLYVPACPWAFGEIDKALGHYRRYSKHSLKELANNCGLDIVAGRYVNFIGAFGWWWCSRVRRQADIKRDNVKLVDRFVPYLSAAEKLIKPIVGQSLFMAFKKK